MIGTLAYWSSKGFTVDCTIGTFDKCTFFGRWGCSHAVDTVVDTVVDTAVDTVAVVAR
jgi:hypothetical protein